MSCWENPATCHGCPYCAAGQDDDGRIYYDDISPEKARKIELQAYTIAEYEMLTKGALNANH